MPHGIDDTSPSTWRLLGRLYDEMSPAEKLRRVSELTRAGQQLALARLRAEYPAADERELRFRLASLWIDPALLRRACGWSPDERSGEP